MNLQSKFGYCINTQTLNISLCKRDGIADRQTDGQKDDPITRCPWRTFQAWGVKNYLKTKRTRPVCELSYIKRDNLNIY